MANQGGRTVATVPDWELQKYMSNPMSEDEIAGTKALGQAVLGLVERAEQTHAKLSQLEVQCARMKNVLYVAVMASEHSRMVKEQQERKKAEAKGGEKKKSGAEKAMSPRSGRKADKKQQPDSRERSESFKKLGTGTLAKSSTTDFINLQGAINPEGDVRTTM